MVESNSGVHPYLPHTQEQRQEMLAAIGVRTFEELVAHIPANIRAKVLDLPPGMSELELSRHISELAAKNKPASAQSSFLGGGSYQRYVPAVVPAIVSRSEFATAYTPYQPEVSQGTLQAIYEFQTAVCLLTGMDVANASMYDGPTACAEAALMSSRLTGRQHLVLTESLNPEYRLVTTTSATSCGLTIETLPAPDGVITPSSLKLNSDTAAVIVQYPNYFGCLEDLAALAETVHQQGALLIVVSDPTSLALLEPPGNFAADIVVGDAQPCGNYLSFGGPSAGYLATRQDFVRQMPGRLCGMTVDNRGQQAFTLTLQTREQHIRRAKATSNICTNQALNALTMLVYLCALGPEGLRQVADISASRAHYLAEKLTAITGVSLAFESPFCHEFVINTPQPATLVLQQLQKRGILGGLALSHFYPQMQNSILIAVTEMNTPSELDNYQQELSQILKQSGGKAPVLSATRTAKALSQ